MGVGKPVNGAVNCGAAVVVGAADSVTAAGVTGALVVAGAALADGATVACVTVGAVDVVGTVSATVVDGTVIDEHAASNIRTASHIAQQRRRRLMTAEMGALRHVPTAPKLHSASGSRTCSKGLLLDICSRATGAIRPNIHHTGRLSREGGTLRS